MRFVLVVFVALLILGCNKLEIENDSLNSQGEAEKIKISNFLDYSFISRNNPNIKNNTITYRYIDPIVDQLITTFSNSDSNSLLVIINLIGYPIWDNADLFVSANDTFAMVPFAFDQTNNIEGYMIAQIKDDSVGVAIDSISYSSNYNTIPLAYYLKKVFGYSFQQDSVDYFFIPNVYKQSSTVTQSVQPRDLWCYTIIAESWCDCWCAGCNPHDAGCSPENGECVIVYSTRTICFSNPEDGFGEIPVGGGGTAGNQGGNQNNSNNTNDIICNALLTSYLNTNSIEMSVAELRELIPDICNCGPGQSFENCISQKIREYKEDLIEQLVANDPWLFINDCLNGSDNPIPDWTDLASFVPSSDILQMLDERDDGNNWESQNLVDANGPVLNVDYFAVTFSIFPDLYGDPMTPLEFLEYVRENFQIIDDNCNSRFDFTNPLIDEPIWNSFNPLGTAFDIDIFLPDDGAVVVSQYEGSSGCYCWTFSTFTNNTAGTHPVSGNRQFGLTDNNDGTWTFYTRGVDRALYNNLGLSSLIGFAFADALWNCMIDGIHDILPTGQIIITSSDSYRPDWELLEEYILTLPLNELLDCVHSSN